MSWTKGTQNQGPESSSWCGRDDCRIAQVDGGWMVDGRASRWRPGRGDARCGKTSFTLRNCSEISTRTEKERRKHHDGNIGRLRVRRWWPSVLIPFGFWLWSISHSFASGHNQYKAYMGDDASTAHVYIPTLIQISIFCFWSAFKVQGTIYDMRRRRWAGIAGKKPSRAKREKKMMYSSAGEAIGYARMRYLDEAERVRAGPW